MHNSNVMIPSPILGQECSGAYMQWVFAFQIIEPLIDSYDWSLFREQIPVKINQLHAPSERCTQEHLNDYQLAHDNLINMFFKKTGIEIWMSDETTLIDVDYNDIKSEMPMWLTMISLSEKLQEYGGVLVGSRY